MLRAIPDDLKFENTKTVFVFSFLPYILKEAGKIILNKSNIKNVDDLSMYFHEELRLFSEKHSIDIYGLKTFDDIFDFNMPLLIIDKESIMTMKLVYPGIDCIETTLGHYLEII